MFVVVVVVVVFFWGGGGLFYLMIIKVIKVCGKYRHKVHVILITPALFKMFFIFNHFHYLF